MGAGWTLPQCPGTGATMPTMGGTPGAGVTPCLSWWLTLFSRPALLLQGAQNAPLPPGEEARRPSPLYPQGWLDTRALRLLWDRLAGGLGFGTLATASSGTARAGSRPSGGLDRPCPGGLRLCWGRQKLSKGTWEGAREPAWMGATTPGTNRGA